MGIDWTNVSFHPLSTAHHPPDLSKSLFGPAHWVRPARTQQLRPPIPQIPRRADDAQGHRSRLNVIRHGECPDLSQTLLNLGVPSPFRPPLATGWAQVRNPRHSATPDDR